MTSCRCAIIMAETQDFSGFDETDFPKKADDVSSKQQSKSKNASSKDKNNKKNKSEKTLRFRKINRLPAPRRPVLPPLKIH